MLDGTKRRLALAAVVVLAGCVAPTEEEAESPPTAGFGAEDEDLVSDIGASLCDMIEEFGVDAAMTMAVSAATESAETDEELEAIAAATITGVQQECPEYSDDLVRWADS